MMPLGMWEHPGAERAAAALRSRHALDKREAVMRASFDHVLMHLCAAQSPVF
jgi:hypothetical protein